MTNSPNDKRKKQRPSEQQQPVAEVADKSSSVQAKNHDGSDDEDWLDHVCHRATFLFHVPPKLPNQAFESKQPAGSKEEEDRNLLDHAFEGHLERSLSLWTAQSASRHPFATSCNDHTKRQSDNANDCQALPPASSQKDRTTRNDKVQTRSVTTAPLDAVLEPAVDKTRRFMCNAGGYRTGPIVGKFSLEPQRERSGTARGKKQMPRIRQTTMVTDTVYNDVAIHMKDLEHQHQRKEGAHGVVTCDFDGSLTTKQHSWGTMSLFSYSNGKSMDVSSQCIYVLGIIMILAMIITGIMLISKSLQ